MRHFFIVLSMFLVLFMLFNAILQPNDSTSLPSINQQNTNNSNTRSIRITYSDFIKNVDTGMISEVYLRSDGTILFVDTSNNYGTTVAANDPNLVSRLIDNGVKFEQQYRDRSSPFWSSLLGSLLPLLMILGVWIFIMRRMQGGGGGPMSFGKSKHKMLTPVEGKVTFDDVAGVDEAKEDLQEIVDFLRTPDKFSGLGGKIPKGVLMVGPPGTGKTLLARACAGEAGVPFFTISGSDFVEVFVGVGASRVRDLFEQARKNAPCIVFIDEIDAVGRSRGVGYGGGNDEREQTLNQILVEMDGFEASEGIVIIAATNRPDVLDPALIRPGRFDRQVTVSNPDLMGRKAILIVHSKNVPLAPDVDLITVARGTPGFSGADLANLVNEAALMAGRKNRRMVTSEDFDLAKDKILLGPERRTLVMTEEEKKLTAYHEAGHAIVSLKVPGNDPIHKATIIPRGGALGMVVSLPERDRVSQSREQLIGRIAMAMGGRVAEEEMFGEKNVTSGASSDIRVVTDIATKMVTELGLSNLGPISYALDNQRGFLGAMTESRKVSDETYRAIDAEVKRIINEGYDTARQVIKGNWDEFVKIAEGLLEYETLTGEEISKLLAGESLTYKLLKAESNSEKFQSKSFLNIPKVSKQ